MLKYFTVLREKGRGLVAARAALTPQKTKDVMMDWSQAFSYRHICRHLRVSLPVLRPPDGRNMDRVLSPVKTHTYYYRNILIMESTLSLSH